MIKKKRRRLSAEIAESILLFVSKLR